MNCNADMKVNSVRAGGGSNKPKYPGCPVAKYTDVRCATTQAGVYPGWIEAATEVACQMMQKNNLCNNSPTNNYVYKHCNDQFGIWLNNKRTYVSWFR